MRLQTIRHADNRTQAVLATDSRWLPLPATDVGELIRHTEWRGTVTDIRRTASADDYLEQGTLPLASVVTSPRKIVCCGHNYRAHIREMGRPEPEYPTLFAKFADTLAGPHDDIELPDIARQVDWEAELALVIGTTCRAVTSAQARDHIAGYTAANDISVRDWQRRTPQWLQGKAFDATTPLGPAMVTADEIDPADGLPITCTVNGEQVQIGFTDDLVFDPAHLVSYISQFTTLAPGDVILTGTPGGVGAAAVPPRYLSEGDTITVDIERIGRLRNSIRFLPHDAYITRDKELAAYVEH
ncbi:fumarylacetoacetate hydrolase family protein [Nocardia uniformis]|uniref:Fumarylacetoacetate hydrolase family protein n=1 Tax=Nocardia uniformis TaxID=53432 RepID=A0A849BUE2_9NOCA|nr:fumarylacetoacetate hydrolase family protein [Nocardia uniformis]NNH68648.1 fumarylacetoacetate hydrolase family protein [Nocardia uniformis]